ncbi:MAG: GtrA family protein [Parasphingorhabdus sp.]|uniref:GtrA family protein n=1 Tax=Parasphingorhabdus sp. TaxID=2709688 RepID=UPI0030036365
MKSAALTLLSKQPVVRFALTGMFNTIFGYSIILFFLWWSVGDYTSNAVGYAAGLSFSYILNRRWSFSVQTRSNPSELFKFIASFLISYLVNIIILMMSQKMGFVNNPFVHLIAMLAYSITFYLLSRYVIFPFADAEPKNSDFPHIKSELLRLASRFRNELATIIFALMLLPFLINIPLTHDVSWQFWIARQINGGTPLYSHIMEINPPLWFWMGAVLDMVGEAISAQPHTLYVIFIIASAVFSVTAFIRLADLPDRNSELISSIFLLILMLLAPIYNFGQREQLAAIFSLPYIALIAQRSRQNDVSQWFSLAVGLFAAVGFAMKHYFVLVPVGLELWLLFELRKNWRPVRWETSAMAVCAVAYITSIFVFTPDFLTKIVPLVNTAYEGYEHPFLAQVLREEVIIWVCILYFIAWTKFRQPKLPKLPLMRALITASLGFIVAYFAQQKGWQYHTIPATVGLSIALFICLANQPRLTEGTIFRKFAHQPFASFVAISYILVGLIYGPYENDRNGIEKYYSRLSAGDSVMIVTADPRLVFPHVEQHHVKWVSRHFAHWMLSAIAKAENAGASNKQLDQVGFEIRQQLVEDISCHSPKYIFINVRQTQYGISPDMFRMTDFFKRNAKFEEILSSHYHLSLRDQNFEIYEAVSKVEQQPATTCYSII